MNVVDLGSGPAILIVHGSPSPPADLLPLAHRLASSHRVLMPELPGYGASPAVEDFSYDRAGDALADLLVGRGVSHTRAIIGYSSGAYRALDLVLRRGVSTELVVGLAALATLSEDDRALFRAVAAGLRVDPSGRDVRPILPGRFLSPAWRAAHPADDARVTAWFDLTAHLADELEAEAAIADLRPLLPSLRCALYLRVGELDLACPPGLSEDIARLAPRALVEVVPGCGHALLIEDAAQTVERVHAVVSAGVP
jgi:3-oxoadipate enol-lactonase